MVAIRSGTVIAGRYQLEALLATGGMGSVWSARHLTLETRLAVKFIGPEVAGLEEARLRFEREAKAAAALQSPHVVQVHDYGVDGGVPFLVMELLNGEDLGARLARRGRLSPAETAAIVTSVARALRCAAAVGIVHRDLKPGNVFLARAHDDEELVKVLDFGVAKAPIFGGADATRSGMLVGSPRYMSPEQVRGSRAVDPRADLWSLAVIAYRSLTGQLPFTGADVAEVILKICTEQAEPPSRIESALGPEIDAFFARALARDPARRFQTAKELAIAFAAAAGEAPPPSLSAPNVRFSMPSIPIAARHAVSRPSGGGEAAPITPTRPSGEVPAPIRDSAPTAPVKPAAEAAGTLTAASRIIDVRSRRGWESSIRARMGYAMLGACLSLAVFVGALLGRATRAPAPAAAALPPVVSAIAPPMILTAAAPSAVAPVIVATAAASSAAPPPSASPTVAPKLRAPMRYVPKGI